MRERIRICYFAENLKISTMHKDKYIFAQLVALLNRSKFNRIVAKYHGDKYVKHFTCWNQLLALMFGQLCNREILRDLICALDAHHDLEISTYEMLQKLSVTLTEKTLLRELFAKHKISNVKDQNAPNGQLILNF